MKKSWILPLVTLLVVTFSMNIVSGLSASDVTISAYLSNSSMRPGDQIIVNVTFDSNVAQELQIYAIGIHADWMAAEQVQGPNFYSSSSGPVTVEANALYSTRFTVVVPLGTSLGAHIYYVGVDGVDSSNKAFSFNSDELTLFVVGGTSASSSTPIPTPTETTTPSPTITLTVTPTPTETSNSLTSTPTSRSFLAAFSIETVLIIAIVAIVLIVCATLAIIFTHKKK